MLSELPRDHACAEALARLRSCVGRQRPVAARLAVLSGSRPECLHLVISGVAARYRLLASGRRQITALMLPGDLCDLEDHVCGRAVPDVVALSACTLGEIPRSALFTDRGLRPEWSAVAHTIIVRDLEIASEWIVSLGRRSAYEAAAHLFCELWTRLDAVGQTSGHSFAFPLTQVDLADVLGMTPVHANRTLRDLRNAGFVSVAKKRATIHDLAGLRQAADFDPTYLLMNGAAISGLDRRGYSETTSAVRPSTRVTSSSGPTVEA